MKKTVEKKANKSTAKAATTTSKKAVKRTPKKVVKKSNKVKAKVDKQNIKDTIKKVVESRREVKYKYPEGMKDPLDKKSWRQTVRGKLRKMEASFEKLTGAALTKARKEYKEYRKEVLLVP